MDINPRPTSFCIVPAPSAHYRPPSNFLSSFFPSQSLLLLPFHAFSSQFFHSLSFFFLVSVSLSFVCFPFQFHVISFLLFLLSFLLSIVLLSACICLSLCLSLFSRSSAFPSSIISSSFSHSAATYRRLFPSYNPIC